MLSFQSHNQVLYTLAQFTTAINRKLIPLPTKVKNQNAVAVDDTDTICHESFAEAVKNFTEFPTNDINVRDLTTNVVYNKNNKWEILDSYLTDPSRELLKKCFKWKISYISGSSFDENKRDFLYDETEPIIFPALHLSSKQQYRLYHSLTSGVPFYRTIQFRHFKTERNVKIELDRNPTFSSRLKKWFVKPSIGSSNENMFSNFRSNDMEKLKSLFTSSNLSETEQKNIKFAFVEGYEAGIQRNLRKTGIWSRLFNFIIVGGLLILISRSFFTVLSGNNNKSMFSFPFGSTHQVNSEEINVTFKDVKGVDDAKKELQDIVEYLKHPDKFTTLGGKLPKGVLLVGPPGTGKTLIARAVAGEAGVPFFYSAGPEFDEILVGQGARRIRDLFRTAKERAPCVIFIDEIDSVGSKRTSSSLHPYANQTINQLLSEMDGFNKNEGVIVLGATNRPEDLDKALLRPGRFDFQVTVDIPDYEGRKDILRHYLKNIKSKQIDVEFLARFTSGFSGADIEYMVNQAALKAATDGRKFVSMEHFEYARDKKMMGPAGSVQKINELTNRITAYHEAGHAVVALHTKDADPMYKVTIIPRGHSMGHTAFIPEKGNSYQTKSSLLAKIDVAMGGRVGEEVVFGTDQVSTGASADFQNATAIVEAMVKKYGMSEKAGVRTFDDKDGALLQRSEIIESEITRLLQESYERARNILKTYAQEHKNLAEALLKYETLTAEEVKAAVHGNFKKQYVPRNKKVIVDVTKNVM